MKPRRLVVVTGTGTEVGKTWVAAGLLRAWREAGLVVAARKPAQSLAPGDELTDAALLGQASGESGDVVCRPSRSYGVPMAPPMAAAALGRRPPTIAELACEVGDSWPAGVDVGLVEGAGGVAAPQGDDGDTVALIEALGADRVVLVADAGLGTINVVRLSMAALAGWPTVVHLNHYQAECDLHVRNRAWLSDRDGFDVTVSVSDLADRLAG